jgi:hypothetical protein
VVAAASQRRHLKDDKYGHSSNTSIVQFVQLYLTTALSY